MNSYREEQWYTNLSDEGKKLADIIYERHDTYSRNDRKYRRVVKVLKILVLTFAMAGTIVFGLNNIIDGNTQRIVGLCVSSAITFVTALSSYFNYEAYWTRNVRLHIRLNILRDRFVLDAVAGRINAATIQVYRKEIEKIRYSDEAYWNKPNGK